MDKMILGDLLTLSHEIGRESRDLVLLAEGNTSAKLSEETYLVKASGTSLGSLTEQDVTETRFSTILAMLEKESMTDEEVEATLLDARVDKTAKKPSVEAMFHAWALTLPGVNYVGHSHATAVNQILCSPRARDFAEHRMFADEIVLGGIASVYVPLVDPGLKLAQAIRREAEAYMRRYERVPRVILMQNHGLVTLGASWQAVLAAQLMTTKAARIFIGAAALGGPVFFPDDVVKRIDTRPDELYRQRLLKV